MTTPNRFFVAEAAPAPITARYAHAVEAGGLLHVTGQLPVNPEDPEQELPPSMESQAELVFVNLHHIVRSAGYAFENTVFARIYLSNFDRDYPVFNTVYNRQFPDDAHLPGRTTVGVARLGRGALVEVDLIVAKVEADTA